MSDPEGNSLVCFPESPGAQGKTKLGPSIKCFVIFLDFAFNSNKRITGANQNS